VKDLPPSCRASNYEGVLAALAARLQAGSAPWAGAGVRAACEATGLA
jgi:hypothetical protein